MVKSKGFKCWRRIKLQEKDSKIGTVVYSNKRKNGNLIVYKVKRAGWFVDRSDPSVGETLGVKQNKSQALKFAKSYMRKHDKC